MKHFGRLFGSVAAILLALVLCVPSVQVSASSYKTGTYKINTKETPLNVRSCPSSENMKVGTVPKGAKVEVTFVSSNGWGKIVYGDVHGWISLEYCKYVGPLEDESGSGSKASKSSEKKNLNFGISPENLTWVWGCKQEYSKKSGLCTSCATGTLLRRRQAAEGKEVTFTFGDTRSSCGGNPVPDKNGYYESCSFYYTPLDGWIHVDEETGEKSVYYTVKEETTTHTRNREYLADLLDVHPEGVVVYANYGKSGRHAILISDYDRHKDGSLSFYAYDPANKGARLPLEKTWIMTKYKSVGGFFSNVRSIWYIKGELTVDDSMFEHPEAEAYNEVMVVAKKKTKLYTGMDASADSAVSVAKGSILDVEYKTTDKEGSIWYITSDDMYIKAERVKVATEKDIIAVAEKAAAESAKETEEAKDADLEVPADEADTVAEDSIVTEITEENTVISDNTENPQEDETFNE